MLRRHPPVRAEVGKAQAAAKPPANDQLAQAKATQSEKMERAKPGEFDKKAFIAEVRKAIDAAAPKTLNDAKNLGSSGKTAAIKQQVAGKVSAGKTASTAAVKSATTAAPDISKAVDKPVTPLAPQPAPTAGRSRRRRRDARTGTRGADQPRRRP